MFNANTSGKYQKICRLCGEKKVIANVLSVCRECIINRYDEAKEFIIDAHKKTRTTVDLPYPPPRGGKYKCTLCNNYCEFNNDTKGFCGLRFTRNGNLVSLSTANVARAYVYLDPHITNCSASWFCPAATGLGYPKYSVKPGPEYGFYNLAVFFYGCNFNCLFCQNYDHKLIDSAPTITKDQLVSMVLENKKVTCICYFGGSPEPHLNFVISSNNEVIRRKGSRVLRICYEWNGAGNPFLVKKAAEFSYFTGGIVKFDLKAPPGSPLSLALTGVDNNIVYRNFELVYREFWEKSYIPVLTATTLLVPGYITPDDVEEIARFIASLNEDIPYSLLVFHPDWYMRDLPISPRRLVREAEYRAKKYLRRVYVGNKFLLNMAPEDL